MKKDVAIIGAGASGLMCAIEAGKRGRSVIVHDHAKKIGNKIRISGGGRCNFTNIHADNENYISQKPGFCKSALARFTPYDFMALIEKHGIPYYEKEEGQLFCEKSSREIIRMLQKECHDAGVEIRLNCKIKEIKRGGRDEGHFILPTNYGTIESTSLVIATGGLSYPELGATDMGYRIARQFGLKVTPLKPALVPFLFHLEDLKIFRELSGLSIHAVAGCNGVNFPGDILFTHKGLSGPAILQISSYWNRGDHISINLLPDLNAHELLMAKRRSRMEVKNLLSQYLPKRFVQKWCELYIQSKPVNQYTNKELKNIACLLHNWTITPAKTEGYHKAEVTLGGVDTDELSSKTMTAEKVLGLYFVGEVIDVTGQLGGYNLHWAWASGYVAGQYV